MDGWTDGRLDAWMEEGKKVGRKTDGISNLGLS